MTTLKVENLSYNADMERQAMDAVAGSGFFGSLFNKAYKWVRRNPTTVIKYARKAYSWIRRWF
jgi:hypothetical protein